MRSLLSEEDACCLGKQSCNTIIQQYFDNRLYSGFSELLLKHMDAMNEISPPVSQVIPTHNAEFGKCVSIIVYAHFFLSDK